LGSEAIALLVHKDATVTLARHDRVVLLVRVRVRVKFRVRVRLRLRVEGEG